MTEALEFAYFQLINGKMYSAKDQDGKLTRSRTALPESNLDTEKVGTVTPIPDITEIED